MLVAALVLAVAQEKPSPEALEFFEKKIRPVLVERCYSCHSAEAKKLKGALRVDSRADILQGGDTGPSAVPGDPEKSLLIKALRYTDPDLQMPPKEKLPAAVVDDFARWIVMGLPWPGGGDAAKPAKREGMEIRAEDRAYWAYRPVNRPVVPAGAHPVDALLLAKLRDKGLSLSRPASREVLIRRAAYDLTGLPPSAEEVDAFLKDPAPDAYEKLLERLLASPRYGEKWGRHWLDLVRFAETNGYERDGDKPNAWRYRDYVIRAFNEDKPYDLFLKEQLAGDEMEPRTSDAIIATGYYRLGLVDDEPADRDQAKFDGLDGYVSTTSQVMLGLTIGCARCHDHKKDPIPQTDYYRFLAFFHGVNPTARDGPGAETVLARDEAGHKAFEEKLRPLEEELKRKPDEPRRKALQKAIEDLKKSPPKDEKALSVAETGRPPDTFLLRRGNPRVEGEKVEPGFPVVLGFPDPDLSKTKKGQSSGRRTVLAEWIANPANPLTSRVMANRLWQHHFGRAIVPTSSDFGRLGEAPTHPELLDWLASELVARRWKLKDMHRLLMTSNAYRAASADDRSALAKDPANELFWRYPMRRLTAEELRDSILAVNGTLNLKAGGPSVFPPLPKEVLATSSTPKSAWGKSTPEEAARRSVYIKVKRSLLVPLLAAHDFADTDSSCAVRFATTVPTQALTLLNSEFMNEQAALFARKLEREAPGDVDAQIRLALRSVTQRPASAKEVARGRALIDALRGQDGLDAGRALTGFCLMALNLNEFVYLD
ncbi:MAG TPA: PSD1 and planctomycete cytochrome C domain-containing protein [Planctomycetota bacterium]